MLKIIATTLLLLIACSALTDEERPCKQDMMANCGEFRGDRDAMRSCMRENYSSFSEACQARIQQHMENGSAHKQGKGGKSAKSAPVDAQSEA